MRCGCRVFAADSRPRVKGFSLFEVVVASSILLMLGLILVMVLIPSFRVTGETQKRASMQQKALLVLRRIGNDVQDAVPAAISVSAAPTVLAGQPVGEFTPEAGRLFLEELWAYYQVGDEIRRVNWSAPGSPALSVTLQTNAPTRLPQADLVAFTTSIIPRALTLTGKVSSFSVTHAGVGSAVAGPITVDLTLGGQAGEPARVEMRRLYSPRLGE